MSLLSPAEQLKELGFDGLFQHVVFQSSDELDFSDNEGREPTQQLAQVYALEAHREELRHANQLALDKAVALSLYSKEERKLLLSEDAEFLDTEGEDEDKPLEIVDFADLDEERKPPPSCMCCLSELEDENLRRVLPCGHLYCAKCVATRCGMGVRDRSMVPAHCCKKEFPLDYVREALSHEDFLRYEHYLGEKLWSGLDLESDREYTNVVKAHRGVQCPGCGVGVQKVTGCNHVQCHNSHEFCFQCGRKWKTCQCGYY